MGNLLYPGNLSFAAGTSMRLNHFLFTITADECQMGADDRGSGEVVEWWNVCSQAMNAMLIDGDWR